VAALVAAQVAATPGAAAVVCGQTTWDYATLWGRAAQVAAWLRTQGVGPETVVGIGRERDLPLVAAVLGVWQAGAAYAPLDVTAPPARVATQVRALGVRVVLTSAAVAEGLAAATPGVAWVPLEAAAITTQPATGAARAVPGAQLAYVITTSGSTGVPKGVALEHRQLRHLLAWAAGAYGAELRAGVLAGTALSFDLSLFEWWVPLTTGGTVILAPDVRALATLPARGQVRLINTVPSALAALVTAGAIPATVRHINVAGEPLRPGLVAAVAAQHPQVTVWDLYGPTETTTYVTGGPRTAGGPETVGRPLPQTTIHVLDAAGQPVSVGVVGEVYVGGGHVARGYVGRPGLTAAAFVPDPWSARPGGRLYRTGDLARWRPDGRLALVGRRDGQVKLRGYRIELGEIDAALLGVAGVREAVTVMRARGPAAAPGLVAYVAGAVTPGAVRTALAAVLPPYMLPAEVVVVAALPRTATGKIDRRALPDSENPAGRETSSHRAPRTPLEQLIAGVWTELLGVERISVDDTFVDLGGHSLLAVQVSAHLRKKAGLRINPDQMMLQTLGQFAASLEERAGRRFS
jgi:amino acid adenylation domain-containing protein